MNEYNLVKQQINRSTDECVYIDMEYRERVIYIYICGLDLYVLFDGLRAARKKKIYN